MARYHTILPEKEKLTTHLGLHEKNYNFSGLDKPKTTEGLNGLRYAEFVVPLVKAVQEQQVIIEEQNKKIDLLLKEIQLIKEKLR